MSLYLMDTDHLSLYGMAVGQSWGRGAGKEKSGMEHEAAAVRSVKDIQAGERHWLERVLSQPLHEDQQILILVLTPGREPDEEIWQRARAALEGTFRKTEAYAREHGLTDDAIDATLREARDHVRLGTD